MNIPGITKVEYLFAYNLNDFKYDEGKIIDVSAETSQSFTHLPISGTASLNEKREESDAGNRYSAELKAYIQGHDSTKYTELANLKESHVFRVTDVTGQQYLLGIRRNPAKFSFNSVNDGDPAGGDRGYNITITWNSIHGIVHVA